MSNLGTICFFSFSTSLVAPPHASIYDPPLSLYKKWCDVMCQWYSLYLKYKVYTSRLYVQTNHMCMTDSFLDMPHSLPPSPPLISHKNQEGPKLSISIEIYIYNILRFWKGHTLRIIKWQFFKVYLSFVKLSHE